MFSHNFKKLEEISDPVRRSISPDAFIPFHLRPSQEAHNAMLVSLHLMYPGARIFTHGDDWIVLKDTRVQQ